MPLYEYQCRKDGQFELIRKFSDPPLAACPKCGAPVEKLLSAPAIQFKGSGWYVTDYARKSGGDGNTNGKNGDGKPADSKSKSDSKSAQSSASSSSASSDASSSTPTSKSKDSSASKGSSPT